LYKIYSVIFGHVYKFLLIFKVGNDFYQLNQLEKEFKRPHSAGPDFGPRPGDTGLAQQLKQPSRPVLEARGRARAVTARGNVADDDGSDGKVQRRRCKHQWGTGSAPGMVVGAAAH
jgi:hypothetical protein